MPVDRYAESVVQYAIWRLFDAPPATPQCGCRASVEVVPQAAEAGTLHLVPGDEPVRWELVAVDEQTVELVAVLADERPLLARRYRASFTPRCDAEARWASPTYGWDMRASIGLVTLRATATAELTCPGHPARTWSVTGDFSIALERVPGRVAVTVSPGTTVGVRLTTGDFDESYRIAARAANDVALWSSPRRVEAHVAPGPASPDDHTFSVDDLSGEACNAVRRTWQQLADETATYDQLDVTQAWQSLRDAGVPGLTTPAETITELETQLRAVIATVKP
jgi:hypothetical protein